MGSDGLRPLPEPRTAAGRKGLAALLAEPRRTVAALDFDGTLAPIVEDPETARAHPGALEALTRLAPQLCAVAVITGRPAEAAVRLGGFAGAAGLERLTVHGAYGAERWRAGDDSVHAPAPPPGVDAVRAELPGLLREVGAPEGTWTEDKGRAIAVHTRRAGDPVAAFALLRDPLYALAERHGLVVEPGRLVLELRPPGVDKGGALRHLVEETDAAVVLYAGDDLGDLAAYDAAGELRGRGIPGLLVCSSPDGAHESVPELADRADLLVPGPAGVVDLLAALADRLESDRQV